MPAKTREAVKGLLDPIRHNDLRKRRRELGLSRVALGRILGVDPATVYRHEQAPMAPLWDYALRGIEAEAKAKESKEVLRSFKKRLDLETLIPDQMDAQGHSYVAEKMHEARQQHAQKKARPGKPKPVAHSAHGERRPRELSKEEIKQAVDRAVSRSARSK